MSAARAQHEHTAHSAQSLLSNKLAHALQRTPRKEQQQQQQRLAAATTLHNGLAPVGNAHKTYSTLGRPLTPLRCHPRECFSRLTLRLHSAQECRS